MQNECTFKLARIRRNQFATFSLQGLLLAPEIEAKKATKKGLQRWRNVKLFSRLEMK